jgi:hypothetical protein
VRVLGLFQVLQRVLGHHPGTAGVDLVHQIVFFNAGRFRVRHAASRKPLRDGMNALYGTGIVDDDIDTAPSTRVNARRVENRTRRQFSRVRPKLVLRIECRRRAGELGRQLYESLLRPSKLSRVTAPASDGRGVL